MQQMALTVSSTVGLLSRDSERIPSNFFVKNVNEIMYYFYVLLRNVAQNTLRAVTTG